MDKRGMIGEDYSSRKTGSVRMEGTNMEEIRVDGCSMKSEDNKGKSPTQSTKKIGDHGYG